jgi:hypothetical protein
VKYELGSYISEDGVFKQRFVYCLQILVCTILQTCIKEQYFLLSACSLICLWATQEEKRPVTRGYTNA